VKRRDEKYIKLFSGKKSTLGDCKSPLTWYIDKDGDGWGNEAISISSCTKPKGYIKKKGDCDDTDFRVHPNQRDFFSVPRKDGSFDFDCDGKSSVRLINRAFCREKENGKGCSLSSGWDISGSKKIPKCGEPQDWAWNECRSELIDRNSSVSTTLKVDAVKKPPKKVFHCWKGKLSWKKRQLCR